MIWEPCDSTDKLAEELRAFLKVWLYHDDYKDRLPDAHLHFLKQGEKHNVGVNIIIVSEPDSGDTLPYYVTSGPDVGRAVLEEHHTIGIVFRGDKKNGGARAISATHNIAKAIFSQREEAPEKQDLLARGVNDVFETAQGLEVLFETDEVEGTMYSQQLNLTCNTDTFIK